MSLKWKSRIWVSISALLLVALGFVLGTAILPIAAEAPSGPILAPAPQNNVTVLSESEQVFAGIYQRVSPSVVSIVVYANVGSGFVQQSSGSGFVIDQQGHIVTNYHVVEGADRIVINFFDGTIVQARVVGIDPTSDLAVIRVDLPADRLVPVPLADSDQLVVGQTVLAIGNPFSRDWTLTSGIISALNRTIVGLDRQRSSIGGVIQTDAAINPGNSGGPLLNLQGEVVGVNSQIEISEEGVRLNAGVGFAIPSNLVTRVAQSLIDTGTVDYSYMGIIGDPIDFDLIQNYDLPNNLRGVAVRQVVTDGPSGASGLRSRSNNSVDVITAINGTPISNFDELVGYLSIHTRPGETVSLTVYRDGQTLFILVTLGRRST